jgi:hypothetical protein
MMWTLTHRADRLAAQIADRHYNRQKIGSAQFVPPGRCKVLVTANYDALWVSSWPFAEYVKHAWAGAWVNSLFRNESDYLSSDLIREAIAVTRGLWPDVPDLGMITFVDMRYIRSANPGYCYKCAGFRQVGHTVGGLVALQLRPGAMPKPAEPAELQLRLLEFAS